MVRIKERYLLVNIVYPPGTGKTPQPGLPGLVAVHQPTSDELTASALARAIKAQTAELFGDYGAGLGAIQGS